MQRCSTLILLAIVVGVAVVGCTGNQDSSPAVEPTTLKVGWSNWPGYYPLIIGIEKGFFEKQGLNVEIVLGGDQVLSNFVVGKVDASFTTLANAIQLESDNSGKAQVVLPVDYSDGGDAFLATTADIKTPADLEGQTLGLLSVPFSPVFATAMLKEFGLSLQSVNQTEYAPSEILTLLDSGQTQAIHVYEPYLSQGLEHGDYHIIYSSKDTPGLIVDILIFQKNVTQDRPEDVRAFINGWFEAVDWWQAHPDEGKVIMAEYLEVPVDEISSEGVAILNREQALRLFEPDSAEATSLYETAALYTEVMTKLGLLQRAPDLESLIDASFVE